MLEKWRHVLIGGSIVIGFVLHRMMDFLDKPHNLLYYDRMYIDQKYLLLASSQLQGFKKKGDYLYNFRCPYCGDSQKSKSKDFVGSFFLKKTILYISVITVEKVRH